MWHRNPSFVNILSHSFDVLLSLSGETSKVQTLVRVMLLSLLKKLESKRLKFPHHQFESTPWVSSLRFLALCFEFCSDKLLRVQQHRTTSSRC